MKFLRILCSAIGALFATPIVRTANGEDTTGTHDKSISRFTDAAVATRHLLFKKGSDADHIAVCGVGAAEIPLGTVADDEVSSEKRVHVNLLGKGPTKRMISSAAIGAGVEVFAAANGKVQIRPVGAGTYYMVGTSITAAAGADVTIEVNDCVPVRVVVP